jgi:aspartate kinase
LEEIFSEISNRGIKIQMMENGARSFSMCVQCEEEKLLSLQASLKSRYKMRYNANVTLITIRHYRTEDLQKMESQTILLEQKNRTIARFVVQNA